MSEIGLMDSRSEGGFRQSCRHDGWGHPIPLSSWRRSASNQEGSRRPMAVLGLFYREATTHRTAAPMRGDPRPGPVQAFGHPEVWGIPGRPLPPSGPCDSSTDRDRTEGIWTACRRLPDSLANDSPSACFQARSSTGSCDQG